MQQQDLLILNLLTGKVGQKSLETTPVSEQEFWKVYLFLLNLKSTVRINTKEIEVFSWILSQNVGECYFSEPNSVDTKRAIPNLSEPELSRVRKKLLELELVQESPDPQDGRRKHTRPIPALMNLQKFVKENNKLAFILSYEITRE